MDEALQVDLSRDLAKSHDHVLNQHHRGKFGMVSAKAKSVLVVEDENDISHLMAIGLSRAGYQVTEVASAEEAWTQLKTGSFDLVLLDWMLPGLSGIEFLKQLRGVEATKNLRVIMVTAKSEGEDIILGLEEGADDYLTKPFDLEILQARVKTVLRRGLVETPTADESLIQIGNLKINIPLHEARCGDSVLELTRSEFKLLLALVQNRGRVLTRKQLIEEVQGKGIAVVDRAVDTHVFGLRKKLCDCANLVETIRGVGYRIIP